MKKIGLGGVEENQGLEKRGTEGKAPFRGGERKRKTEKGSGFYGMNERAWVASLDYKL